MTRNREAVMLTNGCLRPLRSLTPAFGTRGTARPAGTSATGTKRKSRRTTYPRAPNLGYTCAHLFPARDARPGPSRHVGKGTAPRGEPRSELRPHLRKSGLAYRGRCNGPPQGLVCPPPGLESPGPSLRGARRARGRGGKREEGAQHIAARGAPEGCPRNLSRTRPLGAPRFPRISRTLRGEAH